jgi:SAM-dependent methyltransferase
MEMYQDFFTCLKPPSLYQQSDVSFWTEEHISKQLLKAHLDPNFEGASRKLGFIEESVKWISETIPYDKFPELLDAGCGPGLYAERFRKAGYNVTGIDFSKGSIEYAKDSAEKQNLDITYVYQNYLTVDYENRFDLATFIYCDYGALSIENRAIILKKLYQSLKPGGKLLLDVFSMAKYREFQELRTWNVHEEGGFWREGKYLELHEQYRYSDNVTLEQTAVVNENDITTYYIWNCYFTKEALVKEAREAGFEHYKIFSDVAGKPYDSDSLTMAILLEK